MKNVNFEVKLSKGRVRIPDLVEIFGTDVSSSESRPLPPWQAPPDPASSYSHMMLSSSDATGLRGGREFPPDLIGPEASDQAALLLVRGAGCRFLDRVTPPNTSQTACIGASVCASG